MVAHAGHWLSGFEAKGAVSRASASLFFYYLSDL
ncbi:hypothetical protein MED193_10126 [Roseobacter sp. MED193]|nr:hypothetical protein MED193_10126 [Roseobacter sp. MED193]